MSTSILAPVEQPATVRSARARHYVMCRPDFFDVTYAINPWMDPSRPVDRSLAQAQWATLKATYVRLGHRVDVLEPVPGLPDMVFAANGAFVVGSTALGARFREPVRAAEAVAHRSWLASRGITVHRPSAVNEGEGDFAWAYDRVFAASGFRADPAARDEVAAIFGVPVIPLELVDPRFYHLDTALAVLDERTAAYYPAAFSHLSQVLIENAYPDAIRVDEDEAAVLALNAVSDGRHVVLAAQAPRLADAVEQRGFVPVPVDVSELLKAGGGVKCMTLEIHRYRGSRGPKPTSHNPLETL